MRISADLVLVGVLVVGVMLACDSGQPEPPPPPPPPPPGPTLLVDQPANEDWDYFSDATCDPAGGGCTASTNVVAENFSVSASSEISDIVIWGGWWPGGMQTTNDWTVIIHDDAGGGIPGDAIYTQANFGADPILDIGEIFGVSYHRVTLTLSPTVTLSPGTYWVEVFHDSGAGTDDWFWVTGDADPDHSVDGFAEALEAPGVNWFPHDVDSEPPLRRSLALWIFEN